VTAKAIGDAEDAVQGVTRRAAKAGDDFLATMQGTRKHFYGESKAAKMAELVDTPRPEAAVGVLVGMRDSMRSTLETLSERLGKGEGNVAIQRALDSLGEFDKAMVGTISQGARTIDDARAGYVLMDRFKMALGREAGFGRESITAAQK
jgi:hypothetical protein